MDNLGISTGCFYPEASEETLETIAKLGFNQIEFFINTHSEMTPAFIKKFKEKLDYFGLSVESVHPFTSFAESYLFFSPYKRRFDDGIEIYERYFEICNELNAKIINFHGCRKDYPTELEKYCEVYHTLYLNAKRKGVIFAQENVRKYVSESSVFLRKMKEILKDEIAFTFDIKQAYMSDENPTEFIKMVKNILALVHISDHNLSKTCLLPGFGQFDYKSFIKMINNENEKYKGKFIIEVYSNNYEQNSEIKKSKEIMNEILGEFYI